MAQSRLFILGAGPRNRQRFVGISGSYGSRSGVVLVAFQGFKYVESPVICEWSFSKAAV
jgi:hypothetical protein